MSDKKTDTQADDRLWNLIQETGKDSNVYVTKAIETYLADMKKSPVATRQLGDVLSGQGKDPCLEKKKK